MANNITPLDPNLFNSEVYLASDEALITSNIEQNQFNVNTDYIEYFVFDLNNNQISPLGNDATFSNYSLLDNEIYVDPVRDLSRIGIETGIVDTLYTFYRKWCSSSPQSTYYIKEISSDRTEIRLDSNIIDRTEIIESVTEFVAYRATDETFPDFYLNLGSNLLFIANNIKLDTDNTILIKLYEPLPANIGIKTSLWIVEKISKGLAYRVEFEDNQIFTPQPQFLSGPNFNLSIKDQLNNSTEPLSLSGFTSPNSQSEYQINSFFEDPSIQINVDYTNFDNFIHFSSAKNRLENFWDKVSLIESSSIQLTNNAGLTDTLAISQSRSTLNGIINDTITNFDSYEYFLYFETSSVAYPKTNSTPPYQNASTGSAVAMAWSESMFTSASDYDRENQNWLKYSIPEYIRDDEANDPYLTFINMVGHFVDNNIWLYLKDTTNKWNADNRIDAGISKDLVAQVLRDMGVKLYQNNYSTGDLYSSFLGFTDSGSLFPYPYTTGSLPVPSGYEYVTDRISSSDKAIPLDDINKRIYKRIYHNLPYLLKSKGTVEGLRTLINIYGIPDTILRISEFGGKDKVNVNDWDLWKHQYNYKFDNTTTGDYISTDWILNSDWNAPDNRPGTLQFRFNAGHYSSSLGIAEASQSLWHSNTNLRVLLEYDTESASIPSSDTYSGSIISPEYQYANLKFTPDGSNYASIRLPFLDGNWWSVQVNRNNTDFTLYAANKIYSGSDGSQIGFFESASVSGNDAYWTSNGSSNFPSQNGGSTGGYEPFSGSYQEIRYFTHPLSESVFKDYVMNPQSTEGNGINGSYNQLAFRASLGGDLYTGSVSIHPKVSGSYITQSFTSDSNFTISNGGFTENKEWVFYDSPAVGIKNRNTDKIKRQDLVLPEGNTLSNLGSIQQKSYTTQDYTNNLNLLEVAFSPQNQINDDIISQIGFFNIGDYIGDPRLVSSSANTYPSLVELSQQYFDKYSSNYDVYDYIRLIKFFDNSLFKMIKDFVPARTGIATGVVIKQHLLERQKYPTPQAEWTRPEYTGSIGSTPSVDSEGARMYVPSSEYESIPIETVDGGNGGSMPSLAEGSITRVKIGDGGTDFNPSGNYTVTVSGGGGTGAEISIDNITAGSYTLSSGTQLLLYTAQTPPYTPGTYNNVLCSLSGGQDVRLNIVVGSNTLISSVIVAADAANVQIGETITIDASDIGGSTDAVITLSLASLTPVGAYISAISIVNGGSGYTSFPTLTVNGSPGSGADLQVIELNNSQVTQNWSGYNTTPSGSVAFTQNDAREFINGEFSGSTLLVEDGELNPNNSVKYPNTIGIAYTVSGSDTNITPSEGELTWKAQISNKYNPGVSTYYYVDSIVINEIDQSNTNSKTAIQNLQAGDEITFTINYSSQIPPP